VLFSFESQCPVVGRATVRGLCCSQEDHDPDHVCVCVFEVLRCCSVLSHSVQWSVIPQSEDCAVVKRIMIVIMCVCV